MTADGTVEPVTELNDQMLIRRQKLEEWRAEGVEPFGQRYDRTHTAEEIKTQFDTLEGQEVSIAGRIVAKRGHGKASFADLLDGSGTIQLFIKINTVGESLQAVSEAGPGRYHRRQGHCLSYPYGRDHEIGVRR